MDLFFLSILFTIIVSSINAFTTSHFYTAKSNVYKLITDDGRAWTSLWHSNKNASDDEEKKYQTLPRLYVGSSSERKPMESSPLLSKESRLLLDPNQAHYVTRVMRIDGKRRNDLRIFDGNSGEWLARVDNLRDNRGRGDVYVQCHQQLRLQPEDTNNNDAPWVIFAPLKKARTKLLIEKCTELGTGRFLWIQTDRTDSSSLRDIGDGKEKLTAQLVEASEQCERLTLPFLSNCIVEGDEESALSSVSQLLDYWQEKGDDRKLLICRERSYSKAVPVIKRLMDDHSSNKVAFLIGPEGGWSAEEEASFEKIEAEGENVYSVSLGPSVLRAETAAIAAISVFQAVSSNQ